MGYFIGSDQNICFPLTLQFASLDICFVFTALQHHSDEHRTPLSQFMLWENITSTCLLSRLAELGLSCCFTVSLLTTMVYIILHHRMTMDHHDDPASYVDIATSSDVAISTYVAISSYVAVSSNVVRTSYDDFLSC